MLHIIYNTLSTEQALKYSPLKCPEQWYC
uniref:Uncharacterized protein n=1 Tax=Anguilla anguilla TaxID=7936 RepID=A0A0E9QMQ7_ANGAN